MPILQLRNSVLSNEVIKTTNEQTQAEKQKAISDQFEPVVKFRAYISKTDHSEDRHFHYFNLDGGVKQFLRASEILADTEEWQQYIGIKDKNNKEIYVGDIVIAANGEKCIVEFGHYTNDECDTIQECKCEGIGFYFKSVKTGKRELLATPQNEGQYEIIGHIFDDRT